MQKKNTIPEVVEFLINAGHKAPSPDNSQPWGFIWDGITLSVVFDENRAKTKIFGSNSHATLITIGAVLENLSLAAEAAGLVTHWESGQHPGEYVRLRLNADTKVSEDAWDHPLFIRHTNRALFRSKPLPPPLLEQLAGIRERDVSLQAICKKPLINQISSLVNQASKIRFQTRKIHEWLGESLRFNPSDVAGGDGLDVATLALPLGGCALLHLIKDWKRMAFLNRFGAYRVLAAIEAASISKAPAMVAVVGHRGREAGLDAGRVLERAWIALNQRGLAVQPYYVVSDQLLRLEDNEIPPTLRTTAETLLREKNAFFGEQSFVHMLLRVGYPKRVPVLSRRLPLETVFATTIENVAGQ